MSDPWAPPKVFRPSIVIPSIKRAPSRPTGPRLYSRIKKAIHTGGPGVAPADFISPTTSQDEWMWYWASKRVLDPDQDPRQPPFYGGRLWDYQSPELGGFTRSLGSAVVDFLYKISNPFLVVRIVTYRFHTAANAQQQFRDQAQLIALNGRFDVVDVESQHYLGDDTGQTVIVLVKETLGLIRRQNTLTAGTTYLVRGGRT